MHGPFQGIYSFIFLLVFFPSRTSPCRLRSNSSYGKAVAKRRKTSDGCKSLPSTTLSKPAAENAHHWLGSTSLLDLTDPKIRIQALRLTQLATSDTLKAVCIHNFIKSLPFGCVAAIDYVSAAGVLRAGRGDCHTKGTLFVALLRAVGIPARLRFVTLSNVFLNGIVNSSQGTITHAIGEVFLSARWVQTDTYVNDDLFEGSALLRLQEQGSKLGLGIHVNADRNWNGLKNTHARYCETDPVSLPLRDLGVAHDPQYFYSARSNQEFERGWFTRVKWMLAAPLANRRVEKIRVATFNLTSN